MERGCIYGRHRRDILQKARTRLGDAYVFGALTPVGAPDPRVFDCSKLASWAVYQAAKLIYGADNDAGNPREVYGGTIYWNRDARSHGRIVSLEEAAASPGAAVLRLATASRCGHIVISDGLGGTVEAHSTAAGSSPPPCTAGAGIWGFWCPGLQYPESAAQYPGYASHRAHLPPHLSPDARPDGAAPPGGPNEWHGPPA